MKEAAEEVGVMSKVPGMVERVARAIALQDCCDPDFVDTKGRVQWTYHVELARAAIAAMREPDDAMLNRGGYHCITGAGAVSKADKAQAKAVWRAMIDEAVWIATIDAALASPAKE